MGLLRTLGFILNHPLNSDQRFKAVQRFLSWQVRSRLVGGPIVFEWIDGARVIVRRGDQGFTQNIYCGLHDFAEMAYLLHVLGPDDLFVDVGANVGSYTILACGARGARGYCFEPVPSTYKKLTANIAINDLSNRVAAINAGVADKDGILYFTNNQDCRNHVLQDREDRAHAMPIRVCSLDSALESESPTMIKIDVEGFEAAILNGAKETLKKPSLHSLILELIGTGSRYGFEEGDVSELLREFEFFPFEYEPFTRALHPLERKSSKMKNTLFVRNLDLIQARVLRAPQFSVHSMTI